MAFDLPLPRVVADVEKGGPYVTSARGINQLRNEQLETELNRIKAQYAPLTTQAEAASKLAYANLTGPQFLSKLFGNEHIVANVPEDQKAAVLQRLQAAGMGQGTGANVFSQLGQNTPSNSSNSLAGGLFDYLKNKIMPSSSTGISSVSPQNALLQAPVQTKNQAPISTRGSGIMMSEHPEQEELLRKAESNPPRSIEPTGTIPTDTVKKPTYSENVARYRDVIKEGEILGKERGKAISDIGKEQISLSTSGDILDRLIDITQDPIFKNMRNEIPFFQDKQLNVLSKIGTPEQQKAIGNFISTAQAFKASTVNSFKGKALEKEFGLADKIKIDENDTMGVAQGKLSSLKTLKEIAETKNDIILGLMTDEHMNLGDATKKANKLVNTKHIEKKIDNLLSPPTTIMYKNNEEYRIPTDKVEAAKKAGYSNGR